MLSTPKVSMLRLQPTPTCNLNCDYCYIPASVRRQTGTMSTAVLEATLRRLVDEDLLEDRLTISWHGAEPLAAGLNWYEDAFGLISDVLRGHTSVSHVFQSNGVLINDEWCKFFKRHKTSIGVSIDGPEEQNALRVNWAGRPAYKAILRGVDQLNAHDIPWSLLSVVNHATMRDPQAFIRFVRSTGCSNLGFKVEETNVANQSRLRDRDDVASLYAIFVRALWEAFPPGSTPRVREFNEYRRARSSDAPKRVVPVTLIHFRNLTVGVNGDFTIFSGELLFRDDDRFVFGNVMDGPLLDCLSSTRFAALSAEILAGVRRCADTCAFYSDCGSFFISQKHAETGTFDADETLACRLEIKTMFSSLDEVTSSARTSVRA